jgi:hypothetical protein
MDKELVRQYKLALVEKNTLVLVEVIDGQNLSSGPVTHETSHKMLPLVPTPTRSFLMSFHPQEIMSSLDCLGLFYIIHEWINIRGIFILKHHNMRSWNVKPSLETCKIWNNRETLVVQKSLGAPSLCSLEQKLSWKLPQKEMHFLFMFFLHQMLNHVHMKFFLNTKNSKMCLEKKMQTPCPNINCTIDLMKGTQLPFGPIYFVTRWTCNASWIHQWKPQEGIHLTFQVFSWCPNLVYQEEGWLLLNVC